MDTRSAWEIVRTPRFPRLDGEGRHDVVVVDGGMMGLTAASLLTRAGQTVCLLERATHRARIQPRWLTKMTQSGSSTRLFAHVWVNARSPLLAARRNRN